MKSFPRRCLGLLLAPLLLVGSACDRPEEPPRPTELLPRGKMIAVLADLQVLEARVENSRLQPDSARALYLAQQKALFRQQAVTDSTFHRSYRYYSIHGKDLEEIYQAVIDTLSQRGAKLDSAARRKPAGPLLDAQGRRVPSPNSRQNSVSRFTEHIEYVERPSCRAEPRQLAWGSNPCRCNEASCLGSARHDHTLLIGFA